jgi:hypothetical protein
MADLSHDDLYAVKRLHLIRAAMSRAKALLGGTLHSHIHVGLHDALAWISAIVVGRDPEAMLLGLQVHLLNITTIVCLGLDRANVRSPINDTKRTSKISGISSPTC